MAKDYQKRFMLYVHKLPGGCWAWQGNLDERGYGRFGFHGKVRRAHRVAWILFRGEIGENHVLHVCDNPGCVNPKHLKLGTLKQNVHDKYLVHD